MRFCRPGRLVLLPCLRPRRSAAAASSTVFSARTFGALRCVGSSLPCRLLSWQQFWERLRALPHRGRRQSLCFGARVCARGRHVGQTANVTTLPVMPTASLSPLFPAGCCGSTPPTVPRRGPPIVSNLPHERRAAARGHCRRTAAALPDCVFAPRGRWTGTCCHCFVVCCMGCCPVWSRDDGCSSHSGPGLTLPHCAVCCLALYRIPAADQDLLSMLVPRTTLLAYRWSSPTACHPTPGTSPHRT